MGSIPPKLDLASGLEIDDPLGRLRRFSDEEYEFYDGIVEVRANDVEPVDVLSTFSVNGNIEKNIYLFGKTLADKIRNLCREMNRRCSAHLAHIPHDADLLSFDPGFASFEQLLRAATSIRGVGNAVATKILHRKRRNFIPMLDSVVVKHYASPYETDEMRRALVAIGRFREDLRQGAQVVVDLQVAIRGFGYRLEAVRILEILIWTELTNLYKAGR